MYDEAKDRFPEWLAEYKRDRAEHEKARSAHPNPTMLDAEFAAAFEKSKFSLRLISPAGDLGLLPTMRSLTAILLRGARATSGYFDDHELIGSNLGDVDDLLRTVGTMLAPGLEDFLDALAASGSMTMCTNRVYVGNGGESLWSIVFRNVVSRHRDLGRTCGTPLEHLFFRRASFRLLARMSFLSAERQLAVGAAHSFMSLGPYDVFRGRSCRGPWYISSIFPADTGAR